jgi:hypothetical protein
MRKKADSRDHLSSDTRWRERLESSLTKIRFIMDPPTIALAAFTHQSAASGISRGAGGTAVLT